jgi:hypothetical protein
LWFDVQASSCKFLLFDFKKMGNEKKLTMKL